MRLHICTYIKLEFPTFFYWNINKTMAFLFVAVKPQTVSILTKERQVSADKRYDVECRTTGSRPDAVITWWKGSRPVKRLAKNVSRLLLQLRSSCLIQLDPCSKSPCRKEVGSACFFSCCVSFLPNIDYRAFGVSPLRKRTSSSLATFHY